MKIKSFLASFLAIFMLSMSGAWADSVVNPIDQALENQGYLIKVSKCSDQCDALFESCMASCMGLSDSNGWLNSEVSSSRKICENRCYSAKSSCKSSC